MPKSDNQKLKILYILDYLQKNSHQDHPVRSSELLSMLEEHDIVCDRKTVYSDIAALQDYGVDIVSLPRKERRLLHRLPEFRAAGAEAAHRCRPVQPLPHGKKVPGAD